jgi:hypothetical protein
VTFAGDDELERWPVLEEVLAHEARRDGVAPGELLDPCLGPAAAFLSFGCGDETRAAEPRQVGRVTIAVAGDKGLDRRGAVIFAQNPGDGRKQHALAVGARAIAKNSACSRVTPVRA